MSSSYSARDGSYLHYNQADSVKSETLQQFLRSADLFHSEEDVARRRQAVITLNEIVKEWVRTVAWEKRLPWQNANAKLFTFGSYRLEVYEHEADIDTLCITPYYTSQREDFFTRLYNMLASRPEVTELHAIPSAQVPLLRFRISGISIDLLYARLPLRTISEDLDITNVAILKDADDQTIRSLNGCLSTELILHTVPDLENFRTALRYIKHWAKKRGVYSHMVGFLGGVHWALLVAKICLMFPGIPSSSLVSKFFHVYAEWQWRRPVILTKLGSDWRSSDNSDKSYAMRIITPAYPYINASYNVTRSTLNILREEFQRGSRICKGCEMTQRDWEHLCKPYQFFKKYRDFLRISLTAADPIDLRLWKGWVESRFKQLLLKIERLSAGNLQCHPNPCAFVDHSIAQPHCTFFWAMRWKKLLGLDRDIQVDMAAVATEFRRSVLLGSPGMPGREIDISLVLNDQIPLYCSECESHFVQISRDQRPLVGPRSVAGSHPPEAFLGYVAIEESY